MLNRIWAPWRAQYIHEGSASSQPSPGCFLCRGLASREDRENLVVDRRANSVVVLNRYPYNNGHLLVAPFRHIGDFGELDNDEALEIHRLAAQGLGALAAVYEPQGYNLGWNLGRIAGAGVIDHVHEHVVPRWAGDTNFMPVLADVKVLPEHLAETRERLAAAWPS